MAGKLAVLHTAKKRCADDALERLRQLVKDVESGEIQSIVMVVWHSNGDVQISMGEQEDITRKLGALERLKFEMLKA